MEVQFTDQIERLQLGQGATFHGEGILAITKGLLQAGVAYVGGYQGAPVSHLLDVMVQARPYLDTLGVHVEACSNEASAAAMLGASIHYPLRGAVTWKSIVGTNVAADALSNLSSPGVVGGALIVVGEDYGEGASVIQERTHAFALKSTLALFDPRPDLANMVRCVEHAFALSEASNMPAPMRLAACPRDTRTTPEDPMTLSTPCLTRRALALSTLALAAGATLPLQAVTPKDTLVVALAFDDIISLDPAEAFEISAGELMGNGYERLLRYDVNDPSKLLPDLAAKWSVSADGRSYSFELKPNLRFASGNPLTAEDVVFSLQRAVLLDKTPAFILAQFGLSKENVKDKVRQTGPLALTIETDKAYAPTLVYNCLTANVAAVVDKKLLLSKEVVKDGAGDMGYGWLKTNFAGSGPLKIREWRANELVALERNDNYHGKKPALARVIYRHVKESATQRLLIEKGDADIARNLSPQDLDALAGNKDVKTTATPKGTVYYFSLNQKNPILAKPEVREAFKWLVDYDAIGKTLIKNIGVVHQNFLPLGLLGAAKDNPYKLDISKAKALLAKAGHPNGFKVTIDMRTIQPVQGITEAVQQTLKQAGIELEILPGDGKQTLTKYRARQHDIYIGQWGADYWDPHTNADTFTRNPNNADDAKTKPLAWRNAWDIPELTKKTDAAAQERDGARRARLYQEIQAEFRASSPFVMLYQQTEVAAFRDNVAGLKIGSTSDSTYMFNVTKR